MQVPMPYIPSMDVCLKMFDVYTPGRKLHACVNFLTRIEHAEVLVLEFDCFVVGRDGVTMEKYNASTAAPAAAHGTTTTTAADVEDVAAVTDANDATAAPDLDLTVTGGNDTMTAPGLDFTATGANDTSAVVRE